MSQAISDEKKELAYKQVFAIYAKYGFEKISMDEVSARINISKATLYKYFKSKEDIVKHMVRNITAHMDSMSFTTDGGINAVLDSIRSCYRKAVLVTVQAGSVFMADLKNKFPDLYREYITAFVHNRFQDFYKDAVKKGYCRNSYIQFVSI
ncbi:MAG: TetR/AcrR family transcriptional regulator [Clostridiales bacterium]|nr:TetR/AcrR family transcriptional regulator [Clostridiales bacterium]